MTQPTKADRQAAYLECMAHFATTHWPGAARRRADLVDAEAQAIAGDSNRNWHSLDATSQAALRAQAQALAPR